MVRSVEAAKRVDARVVADLDILGSNNNAILGDAYVLTNGGKSERSQLVGAVIPYVERVVHG
jgi:hypothetical protein